MRGLLLGWLVLIGAGGGEVRGELVKPIELRNERLVPGRAVGLRALAGAGEKGEPGLYVVQFRGVMKPEWRARIRESGGRLLRPIPEDAWLVYLEDPNVVRQLDAVAWVGSYRTAFKVERSLQKEIDLAQPDREFGVTVLLDPAAPPEERQRVAGLFGEIDRFGGHRFGASVTGAIKAVPLRALANSPAVWWVEKRFVPRLAGEVATEIVAGSDGQVRTPAAVHKAGFDGRGVVVAVADSGLDSGDVENMHPDLAGRVDALSAYGNLMTAQDGHSHGTHVAGTIAGNAATGEGSDEFGFWGLGVAPGARLIAQRIFDSAGEYIEDPPEFTELVQDAVRAGAVIGSNSWGDQPEGGLGRYDAVAAEFDALVRDGDPGTPGDQPYILEFSAGNVGPGPRSIYSPALAKNVIATGASENQRLDLPAYDGLSPNFGMESMALFSSRGPCEDGRIKPDLVAPGTWIASTLSSAAGASSDLFAGSGKISARYLYQTGTSMAGPHVSGGAAVFVQWYRERHGGETPSPAMVKAALINWARDLDDDYGTGPAPNDSEGWGRLDVTPVLWPAERLWLHDQGVLLEQDAVHEERILVGSSDVPLKVTLAYTDVPGFPAALPALVNDLDLEVEAPDGTVYAGNQFDQGQSAANPAGRDDVNNVEGVLIPRPPVGEYVVRVRAKRVIEDSRVESGAVDQDFALAVSGELPLPGTGIVGLDREAYRAPDTVGIRLVDFDLAGEAAVTVRVTTSGGEELLVALAADGPGGFFSGSIQTVEKGGGGNELKVRHGEVVTVFYEDESADQVRTAEARIDLVPPVISGVEAETFFGSVVVRWMTDEPSRGVIEYGQGGVLESSSRQTKLGVEHEVRLGDLVLGQLYEFQIRAVDRAGNESLDDNGGQRYEIEAPEAALVLVVDAFFDDFLFTEPPPISNYTEALETAGISYELWSTEEMGSPGLESLQPFAVVIWRVPELSLSQGAFSVEEEEALRAYLAGGGSLMIASMELLTRLEEIGSTFGEDILQVKSRQEDVGVAAVRGGEDSVLSGVDVTLDYTDYAEFDISDVIQPTTNAAPILFETTAGQPVGIRSPKVGQENAARVVFLSFPFDAVPMSGSPPNARPELLRSIIGFLAPGSGGAGSIALDQPVYTLPSLVTVEVADSDLAGTGTLQIEAGSDSALEAVAVTLYETVREGLFRGKFSLLGAGAAEGAEGLRAVPGDTIWVSYRDLSEEVVLTATARLDVEAPVLSGLSVVPDYETALVRWSSSEPSDGLVAFGDSAFLNRNVYEPEMEVEHAVTLQGLRPGTRYFFEVLSRDGAGNSTVDDNGGKLHVFETLAPQAVPWVDDLEGDTGLWSVRENALIAPNIFALSFGPTGWELGRPANGRETGAFSGNRAWGSNLWGASSDGADSLLLTPFLDLTGGNRATLRFRHSYDFTRPVNDELVTETAEVYVVRNNGEDVELLRSFQGGASAGWELEEIDLSDYAGRMIQLGFYYGFVSFGDNQLPGWLIDDVAVTMEQTEDGELQVIANLAQAGFTVEGAVSRAGTGRTNVFESLPAGDYVVRFEAVPFYETPAEQAVRLEAGAREVTSGVYSILDGNENGLPDGWEIHYFGELWDGGSEADPDGDGASQAQEFHAGTDPTDGASHFAIVRIEEREGGELAIVWSSVPGRIYQVERAGDVDEWEAASEWLSAGGEEMEYVLESGGEGVRVDRGFLRVKVDP